MKVSKLLELAEIIVEAEFPFKKDEDKSEEKDNASKEEAPKENKKEETNGEKPKEDKQAPAGFPKPTDTPKINQAPTPEIKAPESVEIEKEIDVEKEEKGSNLSTELANFVSTAKAFAEVLSVLKDVVNPPTPVTAPVPAVGMAQPNPAVPAPAVTPEPNNAPVLPVAKKPTEVPGNEPNVEPGSNLDQPEQEGETDPNQSEVPEDVKASFKQIPGKKKFDTETNTVYFLDGDTVMQAPAEDPTAATEVTDQDLLKELNF